MARLLDSIDTPHDLRRLDRSKLPQVAEELREQIIEVVSQLGGHFGGNLGVVELTLALHYVLDTPRDQLVWDTGHQSYPHKLITGRRDAGAAIGGGMAAAGGGGSTASTSSPPPSPSQSTIILPGSITVRPEIFEEYLYDVLKDLVRTGFRNILIINGHGGNTDAAKLAIGRIHYRRPLRTS